MQSSIKLFLLGAPRIEVNLNTKQIRTRKSLALLIYLAVTKEVHRRDALAALFWPDVDTAKAKGSLRYALRLIRGAVGENALEITRQTVTVTASISTDIDQFRALADEGTITSLESAEKLYNHPFLHDFTLPDCPAFDEWHWFVAQALTQQHVQALQRLIEWHLAAEHWSHVIAYAQKWLTHDPLHEPAHRHLMLAYAQQGQQSAALNQYDQCCQILSDELGLDPSPETKSLYREIGSGDFLNHTPEVAQATQTNSNLLAAATSIIGRDSELAELRALIAEHRLVTIWGQGGVGKTRLAIEVAHVLHTLFVDGIWMVDLVAVDSAESIPAQIAKTVQIKAGGDPIQSLIDQWQNKRVLLVLDNLEHLLDGVHHISRLLAALPLLRVLTTSRESLNIAGEQRYPLSGLAIHSDAIRLFVRQVRLMQPRFSRTAAQSAIQRICELTEGLPLALELAAAWSVILSCEQIAEEIARGLDLLISTRRDVEPRHRSMTVVFEHSWKLLTADEQQTLCNLSIFQGGFTRDSAEIVTSANLFILYRLVNKSLLRTNMGRYDLHPLLHQFITNKRKESLFSATTLARKHATYFANLLQQNDAFYAGSKQKQTLDLIETELPNIRSAWQWSLAQHDQHFFGAVAQPMYAFFVTRGSLQESLHLYTTAIQMVEQHHDTDWLVLVALLSRIADFHTRQRQYPQAEAVLLKAIGLCNTYNLSDQKTAVYNSLGVTNFSQGKYAEARQYTWQAIQLLKEQGNPELLGQSLLVLGAVEQALGNYEQAEEIHLNCLTIYEDSNYEWGIANASRFLGIAATKLKNFSAANDYFQRSLVICRNHNNKIEESLVLNDIAQLAEAMSNDNAAGILYEQALAIANQFPQSVIAPLTYKNFGWFQIVQQPETAQSYLQAAFEIAVASCAMPLALDSAAGLAATFLQLKQPDKASKVLLKIQDHQALNAATRYKVAHLEEQLGLPAPIQRNMLGTGFVTTVQQALL